jgi:hypothetical protein
MQAASFILEMFGYDKYGYDLLCQIWRKKQSLKYKLTDHSINLLFANEKVLIN